MAGHSKQQWVLQHRLDASRHESLQFCQNRPAVLWKPAPVILAFPDAQSSSGRRRAIGSRAPRHAVPIHKPVSVATLQKVRTVSLVAFSAGWTTTENFSTVLQCSGRVASATVRSGAWELLVIYVCAQMCENIHGAMWRETFAGCPVGLESDLIV